MIPVSEAAELLGCTKKRVRALCRHGMLRSVGQKKDMLVRLSDAEELERLGIATEEDADDLRRRVVMQQRDIDRLKGAVDMLYQVNDMRSTSLSQMGDQELLSLYETVRDEDPDDAPGARRVLSYCEIFIKLSETEVDRLNDLLEIDDSWAPFLMLCIKISRYIAENPELTKGLQWQRISELLSIGRKNLRGIAVVFIHFTGSTKTTRQLLLDMATSEMDIVDELALEHVRSGRRKGLVTFP